MTDLALLKRLADLYWKKDNKRSKEKTQVKWMYAAGEVFALITTGELFEQKKTMQKSALY